MTCLTRLTPGVEGHGRKDFWRQSWTLAESSRKAKDEKYYMFFYGRVQHDQRSKPLNNCHGRCLLAENRHQFRLVVYLVYSAEMSLSGLLDYHQGGMSWLVPGHFGRGSLDMIPLEPSHPRYCWRSRKGSIHLAQPASNNTSSHIIQEGHKYVFDVDFALPVLHWI